MTPPKPLLCPHGVPYRENGLGLIANCGACVREQAAGVCQHGVRFPHECKDCLHTIKPLLLTAEECRALLLAHFREGDDQMCHIQILDEPGPSISYLCADAVAQSAAALGARKTLQTLAAEYQKVVDDSCESLDSDAKATCLISITGDKKAKLDRLGYATRCRVCQFADDLAAIEADGEEVQPPVTPAKEAP